MWCFAAKSPLLRPPGGLFGRLYPEWDTVRLLARHQIPVRLCPPLKTWPAATEAAAATRADVLITLMTMQIVPPSLLARFGNRGINFHPALLPGYKGPAPRVGMLLDGAGDTCGGITAHVLTPGIDEGPIIAQSAVPRSPARDFLDWDAAQARAAAQITSGPLLDFLAGRISARSQIPQTGSYRRLAPGEELITPEWTVRRVEEWCRALLHSGRLRFSLSEDRPLPITGFDRCIGPPTGAAARVTRTTIECDVRDGRIRLRRRTAASRVAMWPAKVRAVRRAGRAHHSPASTNRSGSL
ncbi:formyltransferase family protein [Pseudohoeflea coraliihabitans]|uniref:formyltransferase family protein n=1 Tax=Pseudohoeflea coraliihabitans TaxID=2860393 RepID=UPI003204EF5A